MRSEEDGASANVLYSKLNRVPAGPRNDRMFGGVQLGCHVRSKPQPLKQCFVDSLLIKMSPGNVSGPETTRFRCPVIFQA